jgi:hypothetical protein
MAFGIPQLFRSQSCPPCYSSYTPPDTPQLHSFQANEQGVASFHLDTPTDQSQKKENSTSSRQSAPLIKMQAKKNAEEIAASILGINGSLSATANKVRKIRLDDNYFNEYVFISKNSFQEEKEQKEEPPVSKTSLDPLSKAIDDHKNGLREEGTWLVEENGKIVAKSIPFRSIERYSLVNRIESMRQRLGFPTLNEDEKKRLKEIERSAENRY